MTITAVLWLLLATPLAARAQDGRALDWCRAAFDDSWFPPVAPKQGETLAAFFERVGLDRIRNLALTDAARKLKLLRRGDRAGHLPSRYLLATYFGDPAEGGMPVPRGVPDLEERAEMISQLAEATFPLAESAVGWRTKDEGFFGNRRSPEFDSEKAAIQRWEFFSWMTRSGMRGNRRAWEALADFYPYQIDRFDGSEADRVRGFAWTHLRSIPIHDYERNSAIDVWGKRKQAAWDRLRGPEEQARAEALARRYEEEIFPRLIASSPEATCALEPQFESDAIADRVIAEPVGPPPGPPPER